jgi:hypothetical protein
MAKRRTQERPPLGDPAKLLGSLKKPNHVTLEGIKGLWLVTQWKRKGSTIEATITGFFGSWIDPSSGPEHKYRVKGERGHIGTAFCVRVMQYAGCTIADLIIFRGEAH